MLPASASSAKFSQGPSPGLLHGTWRSADRADSRQDEPWVLESARIVLDFRPDGEETSIFVSVPLYQGTLDQNGALTNRHLARFFLAAGALYPPDGTVFPRHADGSVCTETIMCAMQRWLVGRKTWLLAQNQPGRTLGDRIYEDRVVYAPVLPCELAEVQQRLHVEPERVIL